MKNILIKFLKKEQTKFNKPLKKILSEQSIEKIADSLIANTPKNQCVCCGAKIPLEASSIICKECQSKIGDEDETNY